MPQSRPGPSAAGSPSAEPAPPAYPRRPIGRRFRPPPLGRPRPVALQSVLTRPAGTPVHQRIGFWHLGTMAPWKYGAVASGPHFPGTIRLTGRPRSTLVGSPPTWLIATGKALESDEITRTIRPEPVRRNPSWKSCSGLLHRLKRFRRLEGRVSPLAGLPLGSKGPKAADALKPWA